MNEYAVFAVLSVGGVLAYTGVGVLFSLWHSKKFNEVDYWIVPFWFAYLGVILYAKYQGLMAGREHKRLIRSYCKERDAALVSLDIEWVRKRHSIVGVTDETEERILLASLHKARYEATTIDTELRHESRRWLQENGFKRVVGDFLPPDQLPY